MGIRNRIAQSVRFIDPNHLALMVAWTLVVGAVLGAV